MELFPAVSHQYWAVATQISGQICSTEDLLSTSDWRELLADFAIGSQTRLIAIKVMRVPGNPLIKGTFWLDDVKILPVAAEADH